MLSTISREIAPGADGIRDEIGKLIDKGYAPIALRGKQALGKGWTKRPNTVEAFEAEYDAISANNIGLRCGEAGTSVCVVGVDNDERDPVRCAAVNDIVATYCSSTPLERIGEKGSLRVYRMTVPFKKIWINYHDPAYPNDPTRRITPFEILGTGRQFAAFGDHPKTLQPFRWTGKDSDGGSATPLNYPAEQLPPVTPDRARDLVAAVGEFYRSQGCADVRIFGDLVRDQDREPTREPNGKPLKPETIRAMLRCLDPSTDRPTWWKIVVAIHAAPIFGGDPGADIRCGLAIEWSRGDLHGGKVPRGYVDDHDVEMQFYSSPPTPHGITVATLIDEARAAGYCGSIDDTPLPERFRSAVTADGSISATGLQKLQESTPILDPSAPLESAKSFIIQHHTDQQGHMTLLHYQDAFFVWSGSHWSEVEDAQMRSDLYRFLDESYVETKDGMSPFKPTPTKVNNVLDALKASTHLAANIKPPAWLQGIGVFDDLNDVLFAPEETISFRNGLFGLVIHELVPHTPQLFTSSALDFDYDPQAPSPTNWFAFLNSVWPDDPEAIGTLQEIFGYLLTADTRQQKIFLIVGPPRSGKGTIARVLTHLLGGENVAGPTLASLGQNFGLQPLIGKPVAIISDARLGTRADIQVVVERLLSISGEDRLTIDRKYRAAWHGSLPVRFLVLTNELPRLTDASGALASRFVPLVMRHSYYGHEDLGLGQRLLTERPGILNWSLVGLDRLRHRGHFVIPRSSAEAQHELEDLSSPIGAFLREQCVVAAGREVEGEALYHSWETWCRASNRLPGTPQTFGRDLRAAVPALDNKQHRVGGALKRFYQGIGLQS